MALNCPTFSWVRSSLSSQMTKNSLTQESLLPPYCQVSFISHWFHFVPLLQDPDIKLPTWHLHLDVSHIYLKIEPMTLSHQTFFLVNVSHYTSSSTLLNPINLVNHWVLSTQPPKKILTSSLFIFMVNFQIKVSSLSSTQIWYPPTGLHTFTMIASKSFSTLLLGNHFKTQWTSFPCIKPFKSFQFKLS